MVDLLHHFNSYMVRLKVALEEDVIGGMIKFQFLYGTIKRTIVSSTLPIIEIFQFLYGTIKSSNYTNKVSI